MLPTVSPFGTTTDGVEVQLYTLRNAHGMQAAISNFGGTLTSLLVPDAAGHLGEVVLGFADVRDYQSPAFRKANPYFGALIGRYANRIGHGRFVLDGQVFELARNDGPHALHGGRRGFDQQVWQAEPGTSAAGQCLTLTYLSPDGEEGYPGNLRVTVVYTLTPDNALHLAYTATTDRPTPLNLTQHAYFNLSHGRSPDVLAHRLRLPADRYAVADAHLLPTGELRPVAGTPFDFRTLRAIGERLGQVPGGYDHNYVLDGEGLRPAATVHDPASGRTLHVRTDQPGLQLYTGNFLDGRLRGHGHTVYGPHAGFCLETQHFPDAPNQPGFPDTVLRPGTPFRSQSEYRFG